MCVLRPRPRLYHHCMSLCSLSAEHEFLKQFINALDFVCRHESTWSQSLRGCCTTTTASRVPVVFEPTRNASMQCPTRALCHQQRLDKGACKMLRCFPTFFQLQDLKSQSRLIFQGSSAPVICHDMSVIIIHHNLTLLGLAGLPMFSGAKPRFRSMGLNSVWWLLTRFRFKSFKRRTRWTWAQEWQLSDFLITGSSGPLAILIDGKKNLHRLKVRSTNLPDLPDLPDPSPLRIGFCQCSTKCTESSMCTKMQKDAQRCKVCHKNWEICVVVLYLFLLQ